MSSFILHATERSGSGTKSIGNGVFGIAISSYLLSAWCNVRCISLQSKTKSPRSARSIKESGLFTETKSFAVEDTGSFSISSSISSREMIDSLRALLGIGPTPAVMKAAIYPSLSVAIHAQSMPSNAFWVDISSSISILLNGFFFGMVYFHSRWCIGSLHLGVGQPDMRIAFGEPWGGCFSDHTGSLSFPRRRESR